MGLLDWLRHLVGGNERSSSQATSASNPVPPPSSPTFKDPWRKIPWGDKEKYLQCVKDYQPKKEGVKHLRVLLYGPVGAGKSSFVNSISSIMLNRMTHPAAGSAAKSETSFTKKYKTHKVQKEDGSPCAFVLNDIMGLENVVDRGVRAEDIKLAMMGHVMEGYEFRNEASLKHGDLGYKPHPSLDDRCHVVVCVISANSSEIKESLLQKMKTIREAARDLEIPEVCVITHIDEACEETETDLKKVYLSRYLKEKMEEFSKAVGFPMTSIFPVKNYSEESDLNDDLDTLFLSVFRTIIQWGDDYIQKMEG